MINFLINLKNYKKQLKKKLKLNLFFNYNIYLYLILINYNFVNLIKKYKKDFEK